MRTSLNNIQQAEAYLQGNMAAEDKLVFEAQMLLNPVMHQNVLLQKQIVNAVQAYGRGQLKAEIELIHKRLFTLPEHQSFRQKILSIFRP